MSRALRRLPNWGVGREHIGHSTDGSGPAEDESSYRGSIQGNRLVYESLSDALPRRLTWILMDRDHATWRNEFALDGETWGLIEEYEMTAA